MEDQACRHLLQRLQAAEEENDALSTRLDEQMRTVQTLSADNARLQNALNAATHEMNDFSTAVSHDLRAPARRVRDLTEIVVHRFAARLDEEGQEYILLVHRSAQRMLDMIDGLLTLSRIGCTEMHMATVDLSSMARQIANEFCRRDPQRQSIFEITPGMCVRGDANLLKTALEHLLENAWKFTSQREVARVKIHQMVQDHELVIVVRDNGAGFDMAYADKLFTPFQRLHTESEFPGTGIGLAIVQRIIHRHGGRVWAEGCEEKGASMFFTLSPAEINHTTRGGAA